MIDEPGEKPIVWLKGEIKTPPFSAAVRREAGDLLGSLQQGRFVEFPRARPMPALGPGCLELRVNDESHQWRIVACVTSDAVIILEVFAKKSARTPMSVLSNCKRRLSAYRRDCE
jgi:phage-related protein